MNSWIFVLVIFIFAFALCSDIFTARQSYKKYNLGLLIKDLIGIIISAITSSKKNSSYHKSKLSRSKHM